MPIKITTANVLRPLQSRERRLPYDKRVKPFNFALIASKTFSDGDTPIALFTEKAAKWRSLSWTGARSRRKLHLGPDDLKTLREKIEFHRKSTEDKSLAPDGSRSDENTKGLLSPMPVHADEILYIGKETDTRFIGESETGEGDRLEPEHVVYRPRETSKMAISPETSKRAKGASLTRQEKVTG